MVNCLLYTTRRQAGLFFFIVSLAQKNTMHRILTTVLLISVTLSVQAQAYEDKIEYNKEKQLCIVMDYKFPPLAVENGFIEKMNKLGYKGKEERGLFNKDKGFRVFKDALIAEISVNRYEYVIYVEKKSRKQEDESVLYVIIMKDKSNVLSTLNAHELGSAKSFLYNLLPDIEAANLEIIITAQEEAVNKSEKKLKGLEDDKDDMEKKIKKLQDDLKDNAKDQEKQQKELENQKKTLDELKNKRKN